MDILSLIFSNFQKVFCLSLLAIISINYLIVIKFINQYFIIIKAPVLAPAIIYDTFWFFLENPHFFWSIKIY